MMDAERRCTADTKRRFKIGMQIALKKVCAAAATG